MSTLNEQREQHWAARWDWLVIAIAVLVAYWPLSSFQWAVAHGDTLNCWLPWRWFIASSLHDGQFPLWNPHQQYGYPMHADLQGPAWYVEAIALGGTIGHGIHVLQGLFLLYLMIGGWGMMRLIRQLHGDARSALIIGVAYALGGFLTGHHQHFYLIISAAWLPWLLHAFIGLLQQPGWQPAARVALIQGLLLTGGNHTFTIIGAYLLIALFALAATKAWRAGGWIALRTLLAWSVAAAIGAALVGMGALHAWADSAGHLSRSGPIAFGDAVNGSILRTALVSFIFPFAPGADHSTLGVDPSMANLYMGAIVLALAAGALFRRRTAIENLLLVFGIACAVIATGDATPVYRWVWAGVPGMNVFRFPSYFYLFTWIAALVLAGGTLTTFWKPDAKDAQVRILLVVALLATTLLTILALNSEAATNDGISLFERMRAMAYPNRVLLGASITVPVLVVALIAAWRKRLGFALLLGLVITEMAWNTSLAVWNNAVSDMHPNWVQRRLDALSEGPIVPESLPLNACDDNGHRLNHLAHATQDYLGGFSRNGVNSFWLRHAMELEITYPVLWNAMASNPVAYLAERVAPWSEGHARAITVERESGMVMLMDGAATDGFAPRTVDDRVQIIGFDRNRFTIQCELAGRGLLVLQQSHYPGWGVSVDGHAQPLLRANLAAMAVAVPQGQHEVVFSYQKPVVPYLLVLSLLVFFGILFALAWPSASWLPRCGAFILLGMTLWSLLGNNPNREETGDLLQAAQDRLPDNASVILNDDGSSPMPTQGDMVGWRLRADEPTRAGIAWSVLEAATAHRTTKAPAADRELHWFDAALKADPAVRAMILDRWDTQVIARSGRSTHLSLTPRTESPSGKSFLEPDTTTRWLHRDSPFGGGTTIALDSLAHFRRGSLVIDLMAVAPRNARAMIVIERKAGDRTTDYRALPIAADPHERPAYAVQPIDEVWRPGEVLKIYLWSHQGDSISERALRVRALPRRFHSW